MPWLSKAVLRERNADVEPLTPNSGESGVSRKGQTTCKFSRRLLLLSLPSMGPFQGMLTCSFFRRVSMTSDFAALNAVSCAFNSIFFSQDVERMGFRKVLARTPASFQGLPDACAPNLFPSPLSHSLFPHSCPAIVKSHTSLSSSSFACLDLWPDCRSR